MEARNNNNNGRLRLTLLRVGTVGLLVALVLVLWQYSVLSEWRDPARLGVLLDGARAGGWTGPVVVAGFLLGSLLLFPVTVMIAATGIALGPAGGLLWASLGSLFAASVNFALARTLPVPVVEQLIGPWADRMQMRAERGGIVAVMVARTVPVAPFTLINFVAGRTRISYRDFLIGTVLGMGPIVAALTVLGDRLRGVWQSPTALNFALLAIALVAWFLLAISLQMLSNRWSARRAAGDREPGADQGSNIRHSDR